MFSLSRHRTIVSGWPRRRRLAQLDNDKCIYNLRGVRPFLSLKAWPAKPIPKPKSTLKHSEGWNHA